MFLPLKKARAAEILDRPGLTAEEIRGSLADIRRINRWLGGVAVLRTLLAEEYRRDGIDQATLLDVGTGCADIPMALRHWSCARGVDLRVVALDRNPLHLTVLPPGKTNGACQRVAAEAARLPFPDRSFTWVTATLFLHHFDDEAAVGVLRELGRVARRAVFINDLERDWIPLTFIQLAMPIFARSPITRFDAPASVRQGFQPAELRQLAARAGFARFRVRRHFPYRLSLAIEPEWA